MTGFSSAPDHERVLDRRAGAAGGAALQTFLHVLAGAEAAPGAGEDRDLETVVMAEFGPGFGERGAQFRVERVEPLRAVHSHDQDLPVFLGFDDGHFALHNWFAAARGT